MFYTVSGGFEVSDLVCGVGTLYSRNRSEDRAPVKGLGTKNRAVITVEPYYRLPLRERVVVGVSGGGVSDCTTVEGTKRIT